VSNRARRGRHGADHAEDVRVAPARWRLSTIALDSSPIHAERTLDEMLAAVCETLPADTFSTVIGARVEGPLSEPIAGELA